MVNSKEAKGGIAPKVSYNLNKVLRNGAVLSNKAYTEDLDAIKGVGLAYQGGKSYLEGTLGTIISSIEGIKTVIELGTGGGSGTVSVPEGISIETYDKSFTTDIFHCMSVGRITGALMQAYDMVNIMYRRYSANPSLDMGIAIEEATDKKVRAYKKKHDGAELDNATYFKIRGEEACKVIWKAVFTEIHRDSDFNFECVCNELRESMKGNHTAEEIEGAMLELRAGLSLFLVYSSFNKAGVNFSLGAMDRFMSSVQKFRDKYAQHSEMGMTEFVHKYFFGGLCGKKEKGYHQLLRIFKTELEIMRRDVTVHQEDFFSIFKNGVFDRSQLIIADPPYPSKDGGAYHHDNFNLLGENYQLLLHMMNCNTNFIMFCDDNHIEVFEPVLESLNIYSVKPTRKDGVSEYIITNLDLPCGVFSTLPADFQELTLDNFEKQSKKLGLDLDKSFDDLDATGYAYTPLKKVEKLVAVDEYREFREECVADFQ